MQRGNITTIVQLCLGLGKCKSDKVDKGTQLLEIKASMIEDKQFRIISYFYFVLFLAYVGFTISLGLQGRSVQIWPIIPFIGISVLVFSFFIKRTYGIYEKGIKIMVRFYPWSTFKGYMVKKGQVAIYYNSFFSGRFILPDKDGNVEKVIMEYLDTNPKLGLLD